MPLLRPGPRSPLAATLGRATAFLAAAALVASLAGCTAGASPSGSPAASGAPSPGASAAPAASAKPDRPLKDRLKLDRADRGRGHDGRAGVAGPITVTGVSGTLISLTTADGWRRSITITDATTITKGGQEIAVADLEVGDTVRLRQERNADGSFTVTEIAVVVPVIAGRVESVGEASLTVTVRGGTTRTVTLTATTTYHVGGADATKADVRVGSGVAVAGEEASGDAFTAISVRIKPDDVAGVVTAKTSDSLTLTRRDGTTVTVHLGPSTSYRVRGTDSPTLADIAIGSRVVAAGTRNADGSLDAYVVAAGKARPDKQPPSPDPSADA